MFRVGSAVMFLVNRPCIARHCPAMTVIAGSASKRGFTEFAAVGAQPKAVIAGLDPAIHRKMGQSSCGKTGLLPPPLWGRCGEGGSCCFTRCVRQLLP